MLRNQLTNCRETKGIKMSADKNKLTPEKIEGILRNQGLSSGRSRISNLNKTTSAIKSLYGKEIAKKKPIKRSFFGFWK